MTHINKIQEFRRTASPHAKHVSLRDFPNHSLSKKELFAQYLRGLGLFFPHK